VRGWTAFWTVAPILWRMSALTFVEKRQWMQAHMQAADGSSM
jgi:hypothetical protein